MLKHMFTCGNEGLYRYFDKLEEADEIEDDDQFMLVRYPKGDSTSKVIKLTNMSINFANTWYMKNREKDEFTRIDRVCGDQ